MARFVEIPKEALAVPLLALGFRQYEAHGQIVMEKRHDCCSNILVKVYTSIPSGGALVVRRAGKDSIRVCCTYESSFKKFGIGKFPYIARVGTVEGVVQRVMKTIRLAWVRGQEWFDENQVKQVMGS